MANKLHDLTSDQITLLKQKVLIRQRGTTSWAELAKANELVSDADLEASITDADLEAGYEYEHACYSY